MRLEQGFVKFRLPKELLGKIHEDPLVVAVFLARAS